MPILVRGERLFVRHWRLCDAAVILVGCSRSRRLTSRRSETSTDVYRPMDSRCRRVGAPASSDRCTNRGPTHEDEHGYASFFVGSGPTGRFASERLVRWAWGRSETGGSRGCGRRRASRLVTAKTVVHPRCSLSSTRISTSVAWNEHVDHFGIWGRPPSGNLQGR